MEPGDSLSSRPLRAGAVHRPATGGAGRKQIGEHLTTLEAALGNGNSVGSIPVRLDAEVMDSAEAILGRTLRGDGKGRLWVRDGIWERVEEEISR